MDGKAIAGPLLIHPEGVNSFAKLELLEERHWYGLLQLVTFAVLFAAALGIAASSTFKKKSIKTIPIDEPKPQTLDMAQLAYEKKRSQNRKSYSMFLIPLFAVMSFNRSGMQDMEQWISNPLYFALAPLAMLPLVGVVIYRARRTNKDVTPVDPAFQAIRKILLLFTIPLLLLMGIMVIRFTAPNVLYSIPAPVLSWGIRIVAFVPIPVMVLVLYTSARKNRVLLQPGDPDYETTMELARVANVKVRDVRVAKTVLSVNASAGLFGTVSLTEGLRTKLTAQERRAILAHEVGHLKRRHVPLLVLFSVGILLLLWVLQKLVSATWGNQYNYFFVLAYSPPILSLFIALFRTPLQRKAEFAADRFALETIGSFQEVAHTLAKVHLLNAQPHTLRKFDAPLATHPSLSKRLTYLSDVAKQLGMTVEEDAVAKILASPDLIAPPISPSVATS